MAPMLGWYHVSQDALMKVGASVQGLRQRGAGEPLKLTRYKTIENPAHFVWRER